MNPRRLATRRWTPPPAPADDGRTARTGDLLLTRVLPTGGHGPEDVVFDAEGRLVAGLADGSVVRLDPDSGARSVLAHTGGRPLGLDVCADGSVLVCDHDRGLVRVAPDGDVEILADVHGGRRIRFASNVAHDNDGTVWFTTSSDRFDVGHYEGDLLEHSCTGRLIRCDPDGAVTTLLDGLAFANGLVLAPDGSHLLFAETAAYRVSRFWLRGERAGGVEPLVANLPGFPDNMSLGSDGLLWVAMASTRNPLLDRLLPRPGFLRTLAWNLPPALRPGPTAIAWVMAFDLEGRTVHDLRSVGGGYGFVTGVAERDGVLALASLHADGLAVASVL